MADYIYELLCPVQGVPRYVGKTNNPPMRLTTHINKARTGTTAHHCARWIRKLLAQGLQPTINVIYTVGPDESWQEAEQFFISLYREQGHPLTNLTDGGDGFAGLPPEQMAMRVAARRKTYEDNPEIQERANELLRAVWANPDVREKRVAKVVAFWADAENRERIVAAMNTDEAFKNRSYACRKRYEDPEERARHSANMAALWGTPERREQARQRSLDAHARPEVKARQIAGLKAAHQKPEIRAKNLAQLDSLRKDPKVRAKKVEASRANFAESNLLKTIQSDQFKIDQRERLAKRWTDPEHRAKMQQARWADDKRAKQAAAVLSPERQAKIKAAMTPEVRARQGEKMKLYWAKKRAEKLAALEANKDSEPCA